MAYEKKEGDIAVFLNERKRNEKEPDWRGDVLIDGELKEVSLWKRGDKGTMLAGKVKKKWTPNMSEARVAVQGADTRYAPDLDDLEDEIHF